MKNVFLLLLLMPIFFFGTSFEKPKKVFSIISYNVWNGFENELNRKNTFVKWARQQKADAIAFQELNGFTQASFAAFAKTWGHSYSVILKETGYPVGISSCYPINTVCKKIQGMHHGCLYVQINGIDFVVVHFSPFNREKRMAEADSVLALLQNKNEHRQVILLGDFNALSPIDSIVYVNNGLKNSMLLQENRNNHIRNLNRQREIDYQVMGTFLTNDFRDAFSFSPQKFQPSYPTLQARGNASATPKKIDHLLFTTELRGAFLKTEVIRDAVTDTLSDHYPIKACFRL